MIDAKIIEPGLLTTIQDSGRNGYYSVGIPNSGPADNFSANIANMLLENSLDDAVLEITMTAPKIQFQKETKIAITGALIQPKINDAPVQMWQTLIIKNNDILSFGEIKKGFRIYIAIKNGFLVKPILGSASTYLPGKWGGHEGRNLISGDGLYYSNLEKNQEIDLFFFPEKCIPKYNDKLIIRVIMGPDTEHFPIKTLKNFFSSSYKVTTLSNRIGLRLQGEKIQHLNTKDIISDGTNYGSIQVPSDGQPIILLNDRGTTGGYPIIATVISADYHLIAQAKPNAEIQFKETNLSFAYQEYKNLKSNIMKVKKISTNNHLFSFNYSLNQNKPKETLIELNDKNNILINNIPWRKMPFKKNFKINDSDYEINIEYTK